jgi:transcriptional regulator with XRE-family HTH domain
VGKEFARNKLKQLREQHKYTIRYVAERVGISGAYVSKIENGKSDLPKPEILERFCDLYNIEMKELFGEEIEVTEEFKALGVEWASLIKEMKDKQITPEEVRKYMKVIETLKELE